MSDDDQIKLVKLEIFSLVPTNIYIFFAIGTWQMIMSLMNLIKYIQVVLCSVRVNFFVLWVEEVSYSKKRRAKVEFV